MTAPDPGLTDLIAAHTLRVVELNEAARYPECNGCDWVGGLVKDHAAHVALVVEQHTNGRITELEDGIMRAIHELIETRERAEKAEVERSQIKDALWTIMNQLDSQAEYLGTGDDGTEWINYARNKIQKAYVECGLHLELDAGRAALEGEQQ